MNNRSILARNRYPVIDGKTSIELKLKTPHQLFDERDPAPFREKDLEDEAVRYILSAYQGVPADENIQLAIYFASMGDFAPNPNVIKDAIHTYFRYEAELKRQELRNIFKQGFISLLIGLTFLLIITYSTFRLKQTDSDFLKSFLHESLFIMGWVAMWRPISIFLYEWWPIHSAYRMLCELGEIEIQIAPLERAILRELTGESAQVPGKPAVSAAGL